jgi:hypothetical protein
VIEKEETIKRLVKAYPGYLEKLESWISSCLGLDGQILWHSLIASPLSDAVCENLKEENYENMSELFLEIEHLLKDGSEEVRNVICTGFLESMQNQTMVSGSFWAPFMGKEAASHCKAMDSFHGTTTEGIPNHSE